MNSTADKDFHAVMSTIIEAQKRISELFPECVLVGGSAAAIHCEHRFSEDADSVLSNLRDDYDRVLERLEALSGWRTNRKRPPVLILGNFHGVDIGIRQLLRDIPLETEVRYGVRIPVLGEMIRVKSWMVLTRNAMRDYIDLAALLDRAGDEVFAMAMRRFDECYPQPEDAEMSGAQLARMLRSPAPYDLDEEALGRYKGLRPPLVSWQYILERCGKASDILFDTLLSDPSEEKGDRPE